MANGDPVHEFLDAAHLKIKELCNQTNSVDCHAMDLLQAGWSPSTIATEMLNEMQAAVEIVHMANGTWLEVKKNTKIKPEKVLANVSACLAEIRAYADLLMVFPSSKIETNSDKKKGPEFKISLGKSKVWVEVCSPDIDRTNLEIHEIQRGPNWKLSEQRKKVDSSKTHNSNSTKWRTTTHGEIAWKIATIKKEQEKNQASDTEYSILWLDFCDLTRWRLTLVLDEAMPLIYGGGAFTSGYLWLGFYGSECDPVFDELKPGSSNSEIHESDLDGRFRHGSKFDMAIISTIRRKIALANYKSIKVIPKNTMETIMQLPGFDHTFSWLEYPPPSEALMARVCRCRDKLYQLSNSFKNAVDVLERQDLITNFRNEPWD